MSQPEGDDIDETVGEVLALFDQWVLDAPGRKGSVTVDHQADGPLKGFNVTARVSEFVAGGPLKSVVISATEATTEAVGNDSGFVVLQGIYPPRLLMACAFAQWFKLHGPKADGE